MKDREVEKLVRFYVTNRFAIVRLLPNTKKPAGKWARPENQLRTEAEILRAIYDGDNIAVVCGEPSGNLVILDFDSVTSYRKALVETGLGAIAEKTFVVASARGYHVYLRSPTLVRKSNATQLDLNILGDRSYAVLPPSLHPGGSEYRPLASLDGCHRIHEVKSVDELYPIRLCSVDQVGIQGESGFAVAEGKTGNPSCSAERYSRKNKTAIPRWWFSVLSGTTPAQYRSRSEAEFAVVVSAVNHGFSFEGTRELFEHHAAAASKYGSCSQLEREKRLLREYSKAKNWVSAQKAEVLRTVDSLRRQLETLVPRGRTFGTDASVYLQILNTVERSSKLSGITLPVRDLGLDTGVDARTAGRALRRLEEAGLIEKKRGSRGADAAQYDLVTMPHIITNPSTSELGHDREHGLPPGLRGHDAFRKGALNTSGWLIVNELEKARQSRQAVTVRELVARTYYSRSTVDNVLRILSHEQLVTADKRSKPRKWHMLREITAYHLDKIAWESGTAGAAVRQHFRHSRERIQFRQAIGISPGDSSRA
jgi:DNA-binding MarR family transcriptional regulator